MRRLRRTREERPWSCVPAAAWLALTAGLVANLFWQPLVAPPQALAPAQLQVPPPPALLRAAALGEPQWLARLLLLGLFGGHSPAAGTSMLDGSSFGWKDLDYDRLAAWLALLLELDPVSQGPLLAAARLFGEVPDADRQRHMIAFIREHFGDDPARRWPWMAHAVFLARHRLQDLPLALEVARELAQAGERDPHTVPAWARQMHLFVLEDMGEVESVKVLIGGLLESGRLADPKERRFLEWRLRQMEDAGPGGQAGQ
jgi:hypothetical protein